MNQRLDHSSCQPPLGKSLLSVISVCLFAMHIAPQRSIADMYDVKRIAYTANVFGNAGSPVPSLNNCGEAAFQASLVSYFEGQGIYKGDGGALTTIFDSTQDSTFWAGFTNTPAINDNGIVAFNARRDGVWGIYSGNGGALTTVALPPDPYGAGDYSAPQIANDNTVYYRAYTSSTIGIYSNPTSAGNPLFSANSSIVPAEMAISVSNNGTIAFITGGLDGVARGAHRLEGIGTGVLSPISELNSLFQNYQTVAVNNSGLVGLVGTLSYQGVYLGDGHEFFTIADQTGPFSGFGSISLNNLGKIAFSATLDSGLTGIFTGADPIFDKVIQTGDALDGSTISRIAFGNSALNDLGQVAFYAELADGRRGVYVATIPEASSLVLASIGVPLSVGYFFHLRRQKRQG